jgi:hypothetical protein
MEGRKTKIENVDLFFEYTFSFELLALVAFNLRTTRTWFKSYDFKIKSIQISLKYRDCSFKGKIHFC